MKTVKIALLCSTSALMILKDNAQTLITFDDFQASRSAFSIFGPTPVGGGSPFLPFHSAYQGLNWNNFYATDAAHLDVNPSGYQAGIISGPNVAYNSYANPAYISGPRFSLVSAYLTAAWTDNLQVEIKGYDDVIPGPSGYAPSPVNPFPVFDEVFNLSATTPTLIHISYTGYVKEVIFTSGIAFGQIPIHHEDYFNHYGLHFAMDNVTIKFDPTDAPDPAASSGDGRLGPIVPEPSTYAGVAGLSLIAWAAYRRMRR